MPTQADSAELDRLEGDLVALLEPNNQAVLTLVRTGKRKRQWIFYGADTAEMKERIRRARELILTRQAGLLVESDPEWKLYRDLVPQ